mgnify:FL=1
MKKVVQEIKYFIDKFDYSLLNTKDLNTSLMKVIEDQNFQDFLKTITKTDTYSEDIGNEFQKEDAIKGLSNIKILKSALNHKSYFFLQNLSDLIFSFDKDKGNVWRDFAERIKKINISDIKILDLALKSKARLDYTDLKDIYEMTNPHALYPTSSYRESYGYTYSTKNYQHIEAVMGLKTFTTLKVENNTLDPDNTILRDIYKSFKRCVCLVDQNVEENFSETISKYFSHHNIKLEKLVYRAMEIDKSYENVGKILGDFKQLGVSRNEPVLIMGGGVLADIGGFACALYHRNTPYVMLATSIVSGIDAGPSPRTCCDGHGYKNLFGAYHTPILCITDKSFYKTLEPGWLRHGVAEIIKMAVVKDIKLFDALEEIGTDLLNSKFGTRNCIKGDEIDKGSDKILGLALKSYVASEYDNLYETHQCRPHAYGHTWSPGFEIKAGLLHGHAVSVGMGLGAYFSYVNKWITSEQMHRIFKLISKFELSLWHDILLDDECVWESQVKMIQKRGGNLSAPIPKGEIGKCGYLNEMTKENLFRYIREYQAVVAKYPREGKGIEPLCSDVGLEDPGTVFRNTPEKVIENLKIN